MAFKRKQEIHEKGFDLSGSYDGTSLVNNYKKIKVGVKTLEDAILDLGSLKNEKNVRGLNNKAYVLKAICDGNLLEQRKISRYFYNLNGIYRRVCDYFAFLYRYDWYAVPEVYGNDYKPEKILKDFAKVLDYLDNSDIKRVCGEIASEVIKDGAYYAYIVDTPKGLILQQLPVEFCRARYNVGNMPAIEFNMKFFDTFTDINYRMRVLKLFPDEFSKGYLLYRQGKLPPDYVGDNSGSWYLLEPGKTIKFNFNKSDSPIFINSIPALLDLDAAQDLDRRKQMQKLLKILVQKLPRDKNGDLIFDIEEARDIHNTAVTMLRRAVGVDVLTTFADVESIDMSDRNTSTTQDDLEKVERSVYNSLGISQNLFNTDGNLALDKSVLNDESSVRNLLLQFSNFFNREVNKKFRSSKCQFGFYMLETTQYNYKELSKIYKEQSQIGASKLLSQIALGQSQSFILNAAVFENEILKLSEIMIPPLMSSTMSSESLLGTKNQDGSNKAQSKQVAADEEKSAGRPEKPDSEKSDKTIQNKESAS